MECPRGSICTESTHTVKTLEKAAEWFPDVSAQDLPVTVKTYKAGNGRMLIKVYGSKNTLIHTRG